MTTTTRLSRPITTKVPLSVRGAQAVFLLPLGLVQMTASIVFSIKLGLDGAHEYALATWAPAMALACVAFAFALARPRAGTLRIGLLLLTAQTAFATVKLVGYHESASLVFFAFVAAAAGLLVLPRSRQYLLG